MKPSKKARAERHKQIKERTEALEKQLEILSIEHEKLLVEYTQLHGAYTILQRSLKLVILEANADNKVGYKHHTARHYQASELDKMELVVSDNQEQERIEFRIVDGELVNDEES